MDLNDEDKNIVRDLTANTIITATQISNTIFVVQETLSRWLLGGAIAIIFAIFNSPQTMFDYYNVYFLKIVIILLLISIYHGLMNVFLHQFGHSLSKSSGFRRILETNFNELLDHKKEISIQENSLEDYGQIVGKKGGEIFIKHLKQSKNLIYQILFLLVPISGILFQLIFMHF